MFDLSEKVALITGAGRRGGIGAGIAKEFIANGASVVVTDIGVASGAQFSAEHIGTTEDLREITNEVSDLVVRPGQVVAVDCDMRDEQQVASAIDTAVESFGRLDFMINNAGVGYLMGPILDFSEEDWDAVLQVNLRGVFFGIKHAAKQMVAQGDGGVIVNIASQAAKRGFPELAAYVASKHGLVGLTRTAALEFASDGINVNSICPNHVTTGLGASQNDFRARMMGVTVEALLRKRVEQIPLGRLGLVKDIANMCLFLCSGGAEYITGQNLDVSGGQEMH